MAPITLKGNACNTNGDLPANGSSLPNFTLLNSSLEPITKESLSGSKLILNCFPSIDTPCMRGSVKKFNEQASALDNVKVLCISQDLPFAFGRFCGAEGIENVQTLSAFRDDAIAKNLGLEIVDGPLAGLFARAIIVADEKGSVVYSELVGEIADEPNYEAALAAAA